MGCFLAVFRFIWKVIKLAAKVAWWLLKILLFRLGLICVGLYLLTAFIIEKIYNIGFSFSGTGKWMILYCVGFGLSVICTAIIIIRRATKDSRKK